jgi:hypothetical protein
MLGVAGNAMRDSLREFTLSLNPAKLIDNGLGTALPTTNHPGQSVRRAVELNRNPVTLVTPTACCRPLNVSHDGQPASQAIEQMEWLVAPTDRNVPPGKPAPAIGLMLQSARLGMPLPRGSWDDNNGR